MTKNRLPQGTHVVIRRRSKVHGLAGFGPHIIGVAGVVEGDHLADQDFAIVRFKHPISHREKSAGIPWDMLVEFEPQYDEIRWRLLNDWGVQIILVNQGKEIAEAKVQGKGHPVSPFPMWREITVRMIEAGRPEVLARGRLCKFTKI